MPNDHDSGYKFLFSTSELVRDLIIGFVPKKTWSVPGFLSGFPGFPGLTVRTAIWHRKAHVESPLYSRHKGQA